MTLRCNIQGCQHNITHAVLAAESINIGVLASTPVKVYCEVHTLDELACMVASWDGWILAQRIATDPFHGVVTNACNCLTCEPCRAGTRYVA